MKITPVIIGSSGWVSSAAQQFFWTPNEVFEPPIVIGSKERICGRFGNAIIPLDKAASEMLGSSEKNFAVFHFAYLTQDKVCADTKAYVESIDVINRSVAALVEAMPVSNFVYASSGAAGLDHDVVTNNSHGKAVYGRKKLEDEKIFGDLCARRKIHYMAPRIFSLGGEHINKLDGYAISNMIMQALNDGMINIRASLPVWRSYINVQDLISILAGSIANDRVGQLPSSCFDATLDVTVEMDDLARAICRHYSINYNKINRNEFNLYATADKYVGKSRQFKEMANDLDHVWSDLDQIVSVTARYLESILNRTASTGLAEYNARNEEHIPKKDGDR